MKKVFSYILVALAGIALGASALLIIFRTADSQKVNTALGNASPNTLVSASSNTNLELYELAIEAAECLKYEDYESLANMVHPVYGLYFSPTATVNLKNNQCFLPSEVASFDSDSNTYVWGTDGDNQLPIEMSVETYLSTYVYDYDYVNASLISINSPAKTGNSLENVTESFPAAQFVDLCFPGTADNEYTDWKILRLVFESYDDTLRLTAIIHSQYTL